MVIPYIVYHHIIIVFFKRFFSQYSKLIPLHYDISKYVFAKVFNTVKCPIISYNMTPLRYPLTSNIYR